MPMPYTLTRGPLLTLVENVLNPTSTLERNERDAALVELRDDNVRLADLVANRAPTMAGIAVPRTNAVPQGGADSLDSKLRADWFGDGDSGPPGEPTGYWVGYRGNVE